MTTDDQISRRNRNNLETQIQMQLSQEPKRFSHFFVVFLKSAPNFEYFEQKKESHSLSISEMIDSERGGFLNI